MDSVLGFTIPMDVLRMEFIFDAVGSTVTCDEICIENAVFLPFSKFIYRNSNYPDN